MPQFNGVLRRIYIFFFGNHNSNNNRQIYCINSNYAFVVHWTEFLNDTAIGHVRTFSVCELNECEIPSGFIIASSEGTMWQHINGLRDWVIIILLRLLQRTKNRKKHSFTNLNIVRLIKFDFSRNLHQLCSESVFD